MELPHIQQETITAIAEQTLKDFQLFGTAPLVEKNTEFDENQRPFMDLVGKFSSITAFMCLSDPADMQFIIDSNMKAVVHCLFKCLEREMGIAEMNETIKDNESQEN